jgi:NAD(P)-dependent dehydrogenase (short-subunit alcohol dehydrogenase family)
MAGRLEGKVALVTGAASGIGAACAARFAREGARVAGLDVAKRPPDAPLAGYHEVDVRDEARVAAAVEAVAAALGGIDVCVNAAGVAGGGPAHLLAAEEWDRILDVNLKGTFLVCKHVLGRMVAAGRGGSIVNLASIEGLVGMEGALPYNASKGGVVLLTRNLAIDYGRLGIRVNCLCPGFIRTPMTALLLEGPFQPVGRAITEAHMLGRIGEPEEVAAAALFLASAEASFVTGHALVVDGGFTAGNRFGVLDPGGPGAGG